MATVTNANQPKISLNQGIGPRTTIVNIAKTNLTDAEVNTILVDMAFDGFTIAGVTTDTGAAFVSGADDVLKVAVQGTATYTAEASTAHGVSGAVTTVLAIFA